MEVLSLALPALSLVAAVVSGVVAWGFATGRWTGRQEGHIADILTQVKEDHADLRVLKETVNVHHGRLGGRIDALEQAMLMRAAQAYEEHVGIYRRLDKLEDKTSDLQRQIDRKIGTGP